MHNPVGHGRCLLAVLLFVGCLCATTSTAQELVPRAYWPAPQGTNLLVAGYQYSTGDVVTDATLPLEGVDASANFLQLTYQRTLSILGRTSNFQVNLPYTKLSADGFVEGEYQSRDISAFADARFLLSINLLGAPTMDTQAFRELLETPRTIVGASILIQPPSGSYETDYVINAGSNRWASKLSLGTIWPVRPGWLFEANVGAWLFGDNDEFVGTTRQQDPIFSGEIHLVRIVRSGFWAALDLNYYAGGQTTVGGESRDDRQQNSRIGVTLFFPIQRRHAIRFAASTALKTTIGGEFDAFSLNYAYAW